MAAKDLSFSFSINVVLAPVWRQSIQHPSLYQKPGFVAIVSRGNQRVIFLFARAASFSKFVRMSAILQYGLIIKNFVRRSGMQSSASVFVWMPSWELGWSQRTLQRIHRRREDTGRCKKMMCIHMLKIVLKCQIMTSNIHIIIIDI